MFGGQVGIAGHITVAEGSRFAAQTGVASTIKKENGVYMGAPSQDLSDFQRSFVVFRKLPEMKKQLDVLYKEMITNKEK